MPPKIATKREHIRRLLACGKTSREIATIVGTSEAYVRTVRSLTGASVETPLGGLSLADLERIYAEAGSYAKAGRRVGVFGSSFYRALHRARAANSN